MTARVYDIRHFEAIKNQYDVMGVPCLAVNDSEVAFGKKNIRQLLERIRGK